MLKRLVRASDSADLDAAVDLLAWKFQL